MKLLTTLLTTSILLATAAPLSASTTQVDKQSRVYSVTRITPNDNLNVRSGPGVNYPVTAVLPFNGKGVIATGKQATQGSSTWKQVTWAGVEGWVNQRYLVAESGTVAANTHKPQASAPAKPQTAKRVVMSCMGAEPRWTIHISATSVHVIDPSKKSYTVPVTFRQQSANQSSIAMVGGKKDQRTTQLFLQKVASCSVGNASYNYSLTGSLDERQVVSGCCRVINQ
ncbi:SH3 domain-containing protein [Thiofilum flexile]|uniref:SH3 domain-containing protein n=1 Tax=Thiofilum flexile TaxID=125627 RepID=UPI000361712B|nr:SH3 domain-containing protein [Thiofilum flexile]